MAGDHDVDSLSPRLPLPPFPMSHWSWDLLECGHHHPCYHCGRAWNRKTYRRGLSSPRKQWGMLETRQQLTPEAGNYDSPVNADTMEDTKRLYSMPPCLGVWQTANIHSAETDSLHSMATDVKGACMGDAKSVQMRKRNHCAWCPQLMAGYWNTFSPEHDTDMLEHGPEVPQTHGEERFHAKMLIHLENVHQKPRYNHHVLSEHVFIFVMGTISRVNRA